MTECISTISNDLADFGFAIVPNIISPRSIATLVSALNSANAGAAAREKNHRLYAMRDLLRVSPEVRELANSPAIRHLVEPIVGPEARPVRGIFFDKTAQANWKVAWHQDLSIAVREKIDVEGFGPWSVKAGIPHVQPPACVLEQMVTVRIHLDDCTQDNGPLLVLPRSHSAGVLSSEQAAHCKRESLPIRCYCPAGGVVLMRPLLLHASSEARVPGHRRVVHIEFAAGELPGGLEWFEEK